MGLSLDDGAERAQARPAQIDATAPCARGGPERVCDVRCVRSGGSDREATRRRRRRQPCSR